jgi:hypothetical protein
LKGAIRSIESLEPRRGIISSELALQIHIGSAIALSKRVAHPRVHDARVREHTFGSAIALSAVAVSEDVDYSGIANARVVGAAFDPAVALSEGVDNPGDGNARVSERVFRGAALGRTVVARPEPRATGARRQGDEERERKAERDLLPSHRTPLHLALWPAVPTAIEYIVDAEALALSCIAAYAGRLTLAAGRRGGYQ